MDFFDFYFNKWTKFTQMNQNLFIFFVLIFKSNKNKVFAFFFQFFNCYAIKNFN